MIPFKDEALIAMIMFALMAWAVLELVDYPKSGEVIAVALSLALIILGILTYLVNQ
jgi:hypothetical protein